MKQKIKNIIDKYEITPVTFGANKGKPYIAKAPRSLTERQTLIKVIPKIKEHFADRQAKAKAQAERKKKNIESIRGLKEIESQREAQLKWHDKLNKSFNDYGGKGVGKYPKGSEEELLKKYPQAAAYIEAKNMVGKYNGELASIGQKVLERFEDNPNDWKKIIADMRKEVSENAREHMWD